MPFGPNTGVEENTPYVPLTPTIGIVHATFSFDTFDELIELATSRVPSGVAFGNDHVWAACAVVAAVVLAVVVAAVVAAVVDDDVTAAVADDDVELAVLVDLWLLPPHAAIATAAATAATTGATRPSRTSLIVTPLLALKLKLKLSHA
jgi:hypothetical protein